MGKPFILVFVPAWLCAIIFLILRPRFTRLLEERHPGVHATLGHPPVGYHRRYTPAESAAIFAEIGYLLKGGFRTIDDPEINRLGHILRFALAAGLMLMAGLAGLVIHDIAISRSC